MCVVSLEIIGYVSNIIDEFEYLHVNYMRTHNDTSHKCQPLGT